MVGGTHYKYKDDSIGVYKLQACTSDLVLHMVWDLYALLVKMRNVQSGSSVFNRTSITAISATGRWTLGVVSAPLRADAIVL